MSLIAIVLMDNGRMWNFVPNGERSTRVMFGLTMLDQTTRLASWSTQYGASLGKNQVYAHKIHGRGWKRCRHG
jgi:hypothetical protein